MAWYTRLFQTIFRLLFILLDWVVYTCVRVFYNLFDAIASIRLFAGTNDDSSLIQEVADRVYVLIGVYALFKVVFVLINMMVNPSDGSKGEKSIGKLATRIFVMLALIIITPYIFNVAYQFQALVLDENVIGKIITGDDMTSGENDDIGQTISNQIFSSFVSVNPTAMENPDESIANFDDLDPESILNSDAKDSCADSLDSLMKVYQQSDTGVSTNDGVFSMIMPVTNVFESSETGKDEFCIEYSYLISTIAGGFAAFAFAVYCLDIGLRVAKLAFYELIAPIPIVSYIDGKKDGPFYKWAKQTAMTYADIFIRLIIINFIILIIKDGLPEIMKMEVITEHDIITQLLAKAAVILGLLMFAKQAPQLICDLLGVESKGTFGFNAKAKMEKLPKPANQALSVAGGVAGGVVGVAGATAVGAAKGLIKGDKGKKGKAITENMKKAFKTHGKAAGSETLARLQEKNYNEKGFYNKSVNRRDLAKQAITGDINAKAGLGGKLVSLQSGLTDSLAFQSSENKPSGLRSTGVIAAGLGNIKTNLNTERMQYENMLKSGNENERDFAYAQLTVDTNFNAKKIFENYLESVGIDKTFQNLPKPGDEKAWKEYVSNYMNFENSPEYQRLSLSEKEAVQAYAEKALGDLKKEVDTQTKNKG